MNAQTTLLVFLTAFSGCGSNGVEREQPDIRDSSSTEVDALEDSAGADAQCTSTCPKIADKRCADQTHRQVCELDSNGICRQWVDFSECPAGTECQDPKATCVAVEPPCEDLCTTEGKHQCSTVSQAVRCGTGPSGCLEWLVVDTCPTGFSCALGACQESAPAMPGCSEGFTCQEACLPSDYSCPQECLDELEANAADALNALGECRSTHCGPSGLGKLSIYECLLVNCRTTMAACLGPWGQVSCPDVALCAEDCDSYSCQISCLQTGAYLAQKEYLAIQTCLETKCAGCESDKECIEECASTQCYLELEGCEEGTLD